MSFVALNGFSADEPKYGTIEIASDPEAVQVYIEGFLAGETPVRVEQIVPGSYRLVLKRDSYEDYVEDIQVNAGEISKVKASLKTDAGGWHSTVRDEEDWIPILDENKKKYEKAESTRKFRDYAVLEIGNFLVKSDEEVPPDHLYALFRDLAKALEEKTKIANFVTNYTLGPSPKWSESDIDNDKPTLVLTGVVTKYERGSRAQRYFVGFGAGKTRMYCLFRFVDKSTGEVLLERMENGSISGGLFGGGSAGATKELAEDIAKALKKNW